MEGKRLAWLILVAVVVSAVNAMVRKTSDVSSNSWLELQWVLFSIVFLCARRGHCWTTSTSASTSSTICCRSACATAIDVIGHAFFPDAAHHRHDHHRHSILPHSFVLNEQSGNAGGLPQWPAKSLIMIGFTLLLVQGISELIKRIAVMRGLIPDPHAIAGDALEAEVEQIVEAIEKR